MDFSSSTSPATLIFSIKPTKKNSFLIVKSLGKTIGPFLFIGFVLGGPFITLMMKSLDDDSSVGVVFIGGILLFFIIWVFSFILTRIQLNNIDYKFYDSKLEYTDGFLIKSKKSIPYSKITNTEQGQRITERIFSLGHIFIDTASSGGAAQIAFSGNGGHTLAMKYLDNSEETYEKINHLIQQSPK